MKTAQLLLPQLVELASATLSGSLENNGLKKMAILLLAACATLNKNYLEIAFQVRQQRDSSYHLYHSYCNLQ